MTKPKMTKTRIAELNAKAAAQVAGEYKEQLREEAMLIGRLRLSLLRGANNAALNGRGGDVTQLLDAYKQAYKHGAGLGRAD